MKTLLGTQERRLFPCPLCGEGLDVRESKKGKPYVVCQGCGLQLFIRTEPGIRRFEELTASAEARNIWGRLADLEEGYKKKCLKCGKKFWVTEESIQTSWFSGEFIGYRCPEAECDGIAKPEDEQ